jgi:hypothetical protein
MKDFLLEMYIKIFSDGFFGAFIGILMWVITLLLIFIVGCIILYLIDSVALKTNNGIGLIINKIYEPANTRTTLYYNTVTKMTTPRTVNYSDTWKLIIEFEGKKCEYHLDLNDYNKYDVMQNIQIVYYLGRFSRDLYVKNIS